MDPHGNSTAPGDVDQPLEEEMYSSWALLILMTLLIGALWTSYYLQLKKIRAIHETVISIMAGKKSLLNVFEFLFNPNVNNRNDCGANY